MKMESVLEKFRPVLFLDKHEDLLPINYVDFVLKNKVNVSNDVIGVVKEAPGNTKYLYYFIAFEQKKSGCNCRKIKDYNLEHIVVHIDHNEEILKVLYAPHSKKEWYWIEHPKCIYVRPCVYVSYHNHASYHKEGTVKRYHGIVRDRCCSPRMIDQISVTKGEECDLLPNVNELLAEKIEDKKIFIF
jgi:hypothetical protein